MQEYPETKEAFIICRTPQRYRINKNITALPWQEINLLFQNLTSPSLPHPDL